MLVSEFIKLADAGYALDDIKQIAGRVFTPGALATDTAMKKLMRFVEKAPRVLFEQDITSYRNLRKDAENHWKMPKLSEIKFESVIDFSEQTENRIAITAEDYQAYFDQLMADDDEDTAALDVKVLSGDGTDSFTAKLHSSAQIEKIRSKYSWAAKINDVDLFYLLSYIIAISDSSSSALNIPVAEGVARGIAWYDASVYVGKLLNSRFTDLFRDFFSADRS